MYNILVFDERKPIFIVYIIYWCNDKKTNMSNTNTEYYIYMQLKMFRI